MNGVEWIPVVGVLGIAAIVLGLRWRRRTRAARLADALLADVLKAKDSFRR
jgi:hypothetical protein